MNDKNCQWIEDLSREKNQIRRSFSINKMANHHKIQICIDNKTIHSLEGHISKIAFENLKASFEIADYLSINKFTKMVFVHGSTGKGQGQIAPNIEHKVLRIQGRTTMLCKVIPEVRDDIDMFVFSDDVQKTETTILLMFDEYDNILPSDVTINVIDLAHATSEIQMHGSPALRRILTLNSPKCLFGYKHFNVFQSISTISLTNYDIDYEIEFKTLMHLATILERRGICQVELDPDAMQKMFPAIYHASENDLHVGFPINRRKLCYAFNSNSESI